MQLSQVESAVISLEDAGADTRVRTVGSFDGFANLDRYEASIMASCGSVGFGGSGGGGGGSVGW